MNQHKILITTKPLLNCPILTKPLLNCPILTKPLLKYTIRKRHILPLKIPPQGGEKISRPRSSIYLNQSRPK